MSINNRVIWSDGLFIKPQHFQQQLRYFESQMVERSAVISEFLYGFSELALNPEYLSFGRLALVRGAGVFPDGTQFRMPADDALPDPLEILDASVANQIVYLALPLADDSVAEVQWPEKAGQARYRVHNTPVRDLHSQDGDATDLDLGQVSPRFMLESEDRSAYTTLAIGRILEKRPDGSLVMDPHFMPTMLSVQAAPDLQRFVGETAGLMRERAKNIAERVGSPNQGGVADVADFMLLQMLNRTVPVFQHLARLRHLHPERLYEAMVGTCAELVTFTDEQRLSGDLPAYNHDTPAESFAPLIQTLRQCLSTVLEPKAVTLRLEERQYGLRVAPIQDSSLLGDSDFILAVKADLPLETLRTQFQQRCKVGSVDNIRELISLQLPGVPLQPLPVAPRQLPYHAGYIYFQLDQRSHAWENLAGTNGIAFHVAGDFPGLEMQFWAIRS